MGQKNLLKNKKENIFESVAYITMLFLCIIPVIQLPVMIINPDIWSQYEYYGCLMIACAASFINAIAYLIYKIKEKENILQNLKKNPWAILLLFALVWACLASFLSPDIKVAIFGTRVRFQGVVMFIADASVIFSCMAIKDKTKKEKILHTFILSAIITSIYMLLQTFKYIPTCKYYNIKAASFYHFNHFAYFLAMAIICSMGIALFSKRLNKKIIFGITTIFLFYTLIINKTLGAYIAVFVAAFMMGIILCIKKNKFNIRFFIPFMLCFATSGVMMMFVGTRLSDTLINHWIEIIDIFSKLTGTSGGVTPEQLDAVGTNRIGLWKLTINFIKEKPIFGYGPEQMDAMYVNAGMEATQAHNEILQYAANLGIPTAVAYLFGMVAWLINRIKNSKLTNDVSIICTFAVIAYFASSCTGVVFLYTVLYLFMFMGLSFGQEEQNNVKRGKNNVKNK